MAIRLRGSSWQADVSHKGQRYRETFATADEAEAWVMEAKAALLRGEPVPRPNGSGSDQDADARRSHGRKGTGAMTLGQCLANAMRDFWRGTASESSQHWNSESIKRHFGANAPIRDIDTKAINNFIRACAEQGNANGTINRKLACLSKALRHAVDEGYLDKMPKINRKKEGQNRIRFLSTEEEQTLLALFRQWGKIDHAEAVEVLIDTGLRNSELWRLEGRDVDLKQGSIHIWQTKTAVPRTVYMTDRVKDILTRRKELFKDGKLFPEMNNYTLRYTWDRARGQMNLEGDKHFIPYICRHTCASRLVQRGVPIPVIKEWLGHKTVQMTMRYAHLAPHNLKAAADILNQRPEAAE